MWWRRRRREWLDGWQPIAAQRLPQYDLLDAHERERLAALVEWLVRTKQWEAARGFSLTQEMVVTVAAHGALLLLGLDQAELRDLRAVVIHPGTVTQRGPRATSMRGVVADGPRRVLGHARDRRGPVVLSWRAVERDLRRPELGHNVVLHELAHKLDAADGLFDGTPELGHRADRAEWIRVCTREYRRLRRRRGTPDPVLRPYAGLSPSEFFAVVTESFFLQPVDLATSRPRLYDLFRRYYGQDPAERARRGEA